MTALSYLALWNRSTGAFSAGAAHGNVGGEHEAVAISRALVDAGTPDGPLTVLDQHGKRAWLVASIARAAAPKVKRQRTTVDA